MGRVIIIRTIREALKEMGYGLPTLYTLKVWTDKEFAALDTPVHYRLDSMQASKMIVRGLAHFGAQ